LRDIMTCFQLLLKFGVLWKLSKVTVKSFTLLQKIQFIISIISFKLFCSKFLSTVIIFDTIIVLLEFIKYKQSLGEHTRPLWISCTHLWTVVCIKLSFFFCPFHFIWLSVSPSPLTFKSSCKKSFLIINPGQINIAFFYRVWNVHC